MINLEPYPSLKPGPNGEVRTKNQIKIPNTHVDFNQVNQHIKIVILFIFRIFSYEIVFSLLFVLTFEPFHM